MGDRDDENDLDLPGDGFLADPKGQMTHGITIAAAPEKIWPWLVQMGCGRAGWYSFDALDNANVRSEIRIRSDLQNLRIGDILPATPTSDDGFEVLALDPPHSMVLGGLFAPGATERLGFHGERPARYWHVTWAFQLEPQPDGLTRLRVRGRAAHSPDLRPYARWMQAAHHIMQEQQLRGIKKRAEGTVREDGWRDIASGLVGGAGVVLNLLTPFLRGVRSHWGLDKDDADREYPGDEFVPNPKWGWTHGIEVNTKAGVVWDWLAQVGADRGGFYSYQWLENLAGCELHNANETRPQWKIQEGDQLVLHPSVPGLEVVRCKPGHHFVAVGVPDAGGLPGIRFSWGFYVEPVFADRTRVISRVRSDYPDDLSSRVKYGPYLTESIGFVMDRRMLLGIKARAEHSVGADGP